MIDRKYDMTTDGGKDERSETVLLFLHDIDAVCRKHKLSIAHEDRHGGFQIEKLNEKTQQWLMQACDITGAA